MSTFFDLFLKSSFRPLPETDPAWADLELESLLGSRGLRLWRPGDPIVERGVRLLVGVAPWSGYDMRLLDVIAEAIETSGQPKYPVVDVFNTADCKQQQDFRQYVPRLRQVSQTPVVGLWRDGRLTEAKQGYEARDLVARLFRSDSAAIVEYVQDQIKARSAT
jgi:hypothetical protein